MKKYLLPVLFTCGIFSLQSCLKPVPETKHVTLDENIKSGTTYSLDLSAYGNSRSENTITTQAKNYTISQIDCDAASGKKVFHFSTDVKTAEKETVVINVKDNRSSHCNNDDQKTEIKINLVISQ